jgi:hypothetical protein
MPVPAYRRASKRFASTYAFMWREFTLRVVHTPDVVNQGWSHIELTVVSPEGHPLPLGLSDRFVHELAEQVLITSGGPVAFISAWLDREASNKAFAVAAFRWRQGRLL